MAWYERYFTKEWEKRFQKETRKQFSHQPHLIDEAFQNAWGKLFEKLQATPRRDCSDPWVFISFRNLLIDEHRSHFGRCRPKSWVIKLGSLWVNTAKELCQTNSSATAIAETVCCHQSTGDSKKTSQDEIINTIIPALKAKSYCSTFKINEELSEEHQPSDNSTAEQIISGNELRFLLNIILQSETTEIETDEVSEHIYEQWKSLSATLQSILNDDDRILLTMIHVDEYSIAKAARMLNKKVHTLRYQLKQTMEQIRQTLEKHDIDLHLLD